MVSRVVKVCSVLLMYATIVSMEDQYWGNIKQQKSAYACSQDPLILKCADTEVVTGQVFGGAFNDSHQCTSANHTSPQPGDCSFNLPFLVSTSSACFWKKSECTYEDYTTMMPFQQCSTTPSKKHADFLFARYDCITRDHIQDICNTRSPVKADINEQYIVSPGYPTPYPVGQDECKIDITVDPGYAIELYIREDEIKLPPIAYCDDAHITVQSDREGSDIDKICQQFGPKDYPDDSIEISFNSGRDPKHYEGFIIRYKKIPLSTESSPQTSEPISVSIIPSTVTPDDHSTAGVSAVTTASCLYLFACLLHFVLRPTS